MPNTDRFQVMDEDLRPSFFGFHDLMSWRVERILLVASLYDAFVLEEDGRLTERIFSQFSSLSLSSPPRVTPVRSVTHALRALESGSYDLVVLMLRLTDEESASFVREVKRRHPGVPVVFLTYDGSGLPRRVAAMEDAGIDRAFLWQGDTSIFLAMIKLMEDQANLDTDVSRGDVRLVVVVEDSVRYVSTFLPVLYREILSQAQALIDEGLNDFHKIFRMRARPKVVLATTYEEALELFERYPLNVLGFLSDIRFPRGGEPSADAGFELLAAVRRWAPDVPFMLLSAESSNAQRAHASGALFLDKNSPTLVKELRRFLKHHLGFGDFIFRLPDGAEVDRARDLEELLAGLRNAPGESVAYHATRNHFSHWLAARGEFALARAIRPRRPEEFDGPEELRADLIRRIQHARQALQRGIIADLITGARFHSTRTFQRLGQGSLGGKSRSIAFLGALLERARLEESFPEVHIGVPRTVALGAYVFEQFVEANDLERLLSADLPDEAIAAAFLAGEFPSEVTASLCRVLEAVRSPLAVRSSSLLEDSPEQPFAGVFQTFMLPNNHPELGMRLEQLTHAIKLVYASAWFASAQRYLKAIGQKPLEQQMGVAIQQVVGRTYEKVFYPTISGVAQTHNFYPVRYQRPEDGVALVALGLGKTITDGGAALRFSPQHPGIVPQLSNLERIFDETQRRLWALDLSRPDARVSPQSEHPLVRIDLADAERHGTLTHLASVYSAQDHRLRDGLSTPGPRVVTFAPILKWKSFPLCDLLGRVLERAHEAMAGPAEIEFSAVLDDDQPEFHLLQIRPLTVVEAVQPLDLPLAAGAHPIVASARCLGHGRVDGLRDVVYVKPQTFDRTQTPAIAAEVARCNEELLGAGKPYVLLGPGRWGTSDPFVGIPVAWDQVCGARAFVEASLPGFEVEPSQGSHFFHNLTAFRAFSFSVGLRRPDEHVDWAWLDRQPAFWEGLWVRRLELRVPLTVAVDGRSGEGRIVVEGESSGSPTRRLGTPPPPR
ncbi:MAG: hypothetical protein D6731_16255 [Planctomycetota bacterium]|nr:MAG: hypothetical protein D6731_16255 [Planctomycetota bacterium]